MRVTCPACAAAYDIPETVLSAGARRLRCARCGHEWESVPGDPVEAVAPATPDPAPVPAEPLPPAEVLEPRPAPLLVASPPLVSDRHEAEAPTGRAAAMTGWLLSLMLLVGVVAAFYVFRDSVQAAWPPSQRLYAALGLS